MNDLSTTLPQAFERGDYHRVAAAGSAEDWRTHAALGLCGNVAPALERLASLGDGDAAFHEGVIRWIDGDEAGAIRLLSHCDNVQATGFVEHLKLPHYVDFQAELDLVRRMRAEHFASNASDDATASTDDTMEAAE